MLGNFVRLIRGIFLLSRSLYVEMICLFFSTGLDRSLVFCWWWEEQTLSSCRVDWTGPVEALWISFPDSYWILVTLFPAQSVSVWWIMEEPAGGSCEGLDGIMLMVVVAVIVVVKGRGVRFQAGDLIPAPSYIVRGESELMRVVKQDVSGPSTEWGKHGLKPDQHSIEDGLKLGQRWTKIESNWVQAGRKLDLDWTKTVLNLD